MKKFFLAAVILSCLASLSHDAPKCFYFVRAYSPYPLNYLTRLQSLENWNAAQGTGLNCSGFVSNAHGSAFRHSYDFYELAGGDLELVGTAADFRSIDESKLLPGDLAAFHGPAGHKNHGHDGVHVAAYLGAGVWIDANGHTGLVTKFRMSNLTMIRDGVSRLDDTFYAGDVRLIRWKSAARFSLTAYRTLGKDDASM